MKLIRFGDPENDKPGIILADDRLIDVSDFGSNYDHALSAGDALKRSRQLPRAFTGAT